MSYEFLRPFSLLLFFNAVFSVGLALYVVSVRTDTVAKGLAAVLFGAGIWSVADGLRIASPTVWEVLFWNQITYIGAGIIAPATLLFVAAYTDHEEWLRPRRIGALGAISVVMILTVFTNHWHGLWRAGATATPGTDLPVLVERLGIVHVGWNVYVLFGVVPLLYVMLGRAYRTASPRLFRRQIGVILVGVTAPVVGSALYVGSVTPIDLTPVGFACFGLTVTVVIHRYRGLELVPIARDIVVENVDAGMFVFDHNDRVVDLNPQAASILGVETNAVVGQQAMELFAEFEPIRDELRTLHDGSTEVSVDVDGEQRHYHADFSTIRDANTHLRGRVLIFNDITEQVNRQEQLVEQTELLSQKNERLDRFASVVSHDLRSPLTTAKLRLEEGMATEDEGALESAGEALDRMEEMIEQLLTLARVETPSGDEEAIELRESVVQAWQAVPSGSAQLEIPEDLYVVEGNPDLVIELFENLFHNAVDHNDQQVTVTVGRFEEAEDDGFYVADDGAGIPPKQREQIFEYGYTTGGENTGFGLSIVTDIVEAHGWKITVDESEAGGARFEITTG